MPGSDGKGSEFRERRSEELGSLLTLQLLLLRVPEERGPCLLPCYILLPGNSFQRKVICTHVYRVTLRTRKVPFRGFLQSCLFSREKRFPFMHTPWGSLREN